MKTSSILLIVIALATFALFFRLYRRKLDKLESSEGFQCKPKATVSKITDRIDKTMRIYINSSNPIVKGGTEKFTMEHIKPMMNDLKNILSLYLTKYCNIEITRGTDTNEYGVPVVNITVKDTLVENTGGNNIIVETFQGSINNDITTVNNFFEPKSYEDQIYQCKFNESLVTEEKKLPDNLGSSVKIGYEYTFSTEDTESNVEGKLFLVNVTQENKEHLLNSQSNKTAKGEATITPFVNSGDTIKLVFKCDEDNNINWTNIKDLNLIYVPDNLDEDELLEDEEEEYSELSLPFEDQITKFCYDRNDCPYFYIDFKILIKEPSIELISFFTLGKINDDEDFLQLVELIGNGRKYNSVQKGMFRAIHLSKTFFFARKYADVDINERCLLEKFTSNESLGEVLNRELGTSEFDNSTLIEEYYSQRGQNLLFIKENIRNNLIKSCKNDKLKEFLVENKDSMDTITKLDKNSNLLKSMINMTGDFSGENDKEIDKISSKWNEFHSMYNSQLEDLLVEKLDLTDSNHRIERDTHKYRINKYKQELEKIRKDNNPNSESYDKFYRNQEVSLQNQNDGTVLNYSRVSERGKFVDKYMIFANGGCLKNLGGKLVIEYDYNFQRNNPNLHFNFEVINNPKDYIAKMNLSLVDEKRNRNFTMNEVPTVLISPVGMYGRVLAIENENIFLRNCNGKLSERFRFRELIESPCDFPEKEVN